MFDYCKLEDFTGLKITLPAAVFIPKEMTTPPCDVTRLERRCLVHRIDIIVEPTKSSKKSYWKTAFSFQSASLGFFCPLPKVSNCKKGGGVTKRTAKARHT